MRFDRDPIGFARGLAWQIGAGDKRRSRDLVLGAGVPDFDGGAFRIEGDVEAFAAVARRDVRRDERREGLGRCRLGPPQELRALPIDGGLDFNVAVDTDAQGRAGAGREGQRNLTNRKQDARDRYETKRVSISGGVLHEISHSLCKFNTRRGQPFRNADGAEHVVPDK